MFYGGCPVVCDHELITDYYFAKDFVLSHSVKICVVAVTNQFIVTEQ